MNDGPEIRHAELGDPMFELCFEAMEAMRQATLFVASRMDDPRDAITVVMTAASMFSGMQAGTLLATGALRNQDKARTAAAAATNFREGMKAGQIRGLRLATEEFGGTA